MSGLQINTFKFLIFFENYIYIFINKNSNCLFLNYKFYVVYIFYKFYCLFFINYLYGYVYYGFIKKCRFVFFNLNFYIFEYFLDGLYFRVKYYKQFNSLGFILGYNHYIYIVLPSTIRCKVHMKKRRFFLYSLNFLDLNKFSIILVNLKYPNLFKGKGVKLRYINYRKKIILKKK